MPDLVISRTPNSKEHRRRRRRFTYGNPNFSFQKGFTALPEGPMIPLFFRLIERNDRPFRPHEDLVGSIPGPKGPGWVNCWPTWAARLEPPEFLKNNRFDDLFDHLFQKTVSQHIRRGGTLVNDSACRRAGRFDIGSDVMLPTSLKQAGPPREMK